MNGRIIIFGKGGISGGIAKVMGGLGYEVGELAKGYADVRDRKRLDKVLRELEPIWVVNCAGISDQHDETAELVCATNLLGAINVTEAVQASMVERKIGLGVIHLASTAGIVTTRRHAYYGASKAGLIRYVQAMGDGGFPVWAISPGRVDTPLRDADYPNEDIETRLQPFQVGVVVSNIVAGHYAKGANVVVRKVGTQRVDVYQEPQADLPSMLS